MDNTTEYCSFVSIDYIICECGETFPNEDELKEHLDNDHIVSKQEKPSILCENLIKDEPVKTEPKSDPEPEPKPEEATVPCVITENLPEANMQANHVYLFDMQQEDHLQNEYYLEMEDNTTGVENLPFVLPQDIKQEDIIVQYIDQDGNYIDQEGTGTVIEEIITEPSLPCKQVTFKKEQIADEVVILAQENLEHDYDREADRPVYQEYYFCETCGKSFLSEKSVHMHMQRMHNVGGTKQQKNNNKNAVCDVCGKKYVMWQRVCCGVRRPPGKPGLRMGDRNKTKQVKLFTCDICGVTRKSNAALRYHQRVHTGERPYHCSECPKTFTMPLFLQLHLRTHTGERPYQCPHCPKAFSNQAALVRHDRVHTGVKPYPCPECGKAFTQSNSMKLHYQTVHLKMPAPYKSAARRLRDMQKLVLMSPTRKIRKAHIHKEQPHLSPPRDKLLFRHKPTTQYEYVVEEVGYDNEDYEDEFTVTTH